MAQNGQLVLDIAPEPSFAAEDFVLGAANREAYQLATELSWPTPIGVILGGAGAGKTHLAHMHATRFSAPLWYGGAAPVDVPYDATVIIDGLERWIGADDDALFHTLEAARAHQTPVLVTSRTAPEALQLKRPDTLSRLRAGVRASLFAPDDTLFQAIAVKLFTDRQLMVDPNVATYLLQRMERSYANLSRLIALIDERSLAAGRSITKALAGEVLAAYELSQI